MTESMEASNPLPLHPADGSYRVVRKDREQDRQKRFDSLFKDEGEEEREDERGDQPGIGAIEDVFVKNGVAEHKKTNKNASDENTNGTPSDRGSIVDVKA